jgi:cob(I)alamin adenosyltransferase
MGTLTQPNLLKRAAEVKNELTFFIESQDVSSGFRKIWMSLFFILPGSGLCEIRRGGPLSAATHPKESKMRVSGKIHIYTGTGKGKTTAALGLVVRAAGAGWAVFVGHFIKSEPTSEHAALARLAPEITVAFFGRGGLIGKSPDAKDKAAAEKGLSVCREAMVSGDYRLVVLDEVVVAAAKGALTEAAVLETIAARPRDVELVLTGRGAGDRMIAAADLVTEMREVKHYFSTGFQARAGVEK